MTHIETDEENLFEVLRDLIRQSMFRNLECFRTYVETNQYVIFFIGCRTTVCSHLGLVKLGIRPSS